jgi:hypothetical protein
MNLNLKLKLTFLMSLVIAVSSANAEWIDFTGWDDSAINAGGQTFEDVCGDIDVTVTGIGNSFPTSFSGNDIFIGGNTDAMSLTFTFSGAVDATMDIHTLDPDEILTITGGNPATYSHIFGAVPTQTGNLILQGNGFGINPTGASHGEMDLGTVTSFTVSYEALSDNKFERFSVGCSEAVPEPGSIALVLIGGLSLLFGRRSF